jgi:S-adenosylmethionine:tRNA ribosyltransferase-isomerase
MKTELFDYHLPLEKIAQHPLESRDSSRLLIVQNTKDKVQSEEKFEEIIFRDITQLFHARDVLVINDTKVMPARIGGHTLLKNGEKKEVECLFLRNTAPDIWEIMCFPGERLKIGRQIILENGMTLEVV